MRCECNRNLEETVMSMTTDTGITYKIFICRNCKKYYIKRFKWLNEIEYDAQGKWHFNGETIAITECVFYR